ncbi:MAG: hypothetical protein EHM55_17090, partial [Acidobacteria bacterium]
MMDSGHATSLRSPAFRIGHLRASRRRRRVGTAGTGRAANQGDVGGRRPVVDTCPTSHAARQRRPAKRGAAADCHDYERCMLDALPTHCSRTYYPASSTCSARVRAVVLHDEASAMRTRTSVMLLAAGALGAASIRRGLSLVEAVAGRPVLDGYGAPPTRPRVNQPDLLKRRAANDDQSTTTIRTTHHRLVERTRAEYDRYLAGTRREPPVMDVLIISGGGDWGAFGAGFLKGWQQIPPHHPLAKPEFDAVTGVSTGTLIAPFAFLGDEPSVDQIVNLYRNPQKDWVKHRGVLYFLPDNLSFAEVPGLEREIRKYVTVDMARRIAVAGADGRLLAVSTTDLDQGTARVFDLVAEAQRAADSGQLDRVHNIMLASAGIPGAFPFRMIDDDLYVDGGVT